ncbi:hypothetical protein [Bradyrhizobium vignae]|uniref:hypothetical protein n=1 Tax=Bradyrhizobium vignae TaxID=1549949 RepID=UPI00100B81AF|nr:hypothetical protein [Bradyrhizobium vignae]RXH05199.1 hypothetical protein EAV90_07330 [Bradyrhizobium vignae]
MADPIPFSGARARRSVKLHRLDALADEVGSIDTVIQQLAGLHKETGETWSKYDKIERLSGKIDASVERLKDAHAAGLRAGAAAALAASKR